MLPASLKSSPRSIYLLTSDEPLLIRDWLDSARVTLHDQGFEEILSHQVESGFDWDAVLEDSQSLSLFSQKKCHIIRFNSNKPGQGGARFIAQICESPVEDTVFILVLGKLDQASKNSAWVKKVRQAGELCELKPVYQNELVKWIEQRALSKGLQLDQQAAMYVADLTEGNLLASDQELEKLVLSSEPGLVLNLEQISEAIQRSSRYTHFQLLDACLAARTKRVNKILQGLQLEGFQPVQILYPIQSAIEVLLQLKRAQQKNQLNANVWQSLRIWSSKQRLYSSALNRLTQAQMERLLKSCATLDRVNKGQIQPAYEDADWLYLKQLVNAFCGNHKHEYLSA
jgi:DNA polymerase-3 subunit delta